MVVPHHHQHGVEHVLDLYGVEGQHFHLDYGHGILEPEADAHELLELHRHAHEVHTVAEPGEVHTGMIAEVWTGHEWKEGRVYDRVGNEDGDGFHVGVFGETGTRFFADIQIRNPWPAARERLEAEMAAEPSDDEVEENLADALGPVPFEQWRLRTHSCATCLEIWETLPATDEAMRIIRSHAEFAHSETLVANPLV